MGMGDVSAIVYINISLKPVLMYRSVFVLEDQGHSYRENNQQ